MKPYVILCASAFWFLACSTSRPAPSLPCGISTFADELLATQKRFAGAAGESYVVLAKDGFLPEGQTETFTFQQVDIPSLTFLPTYVRVSFGPRSDVGDNFHAPVSTAASPMRFAGRRVPPGDYALVYVSNQNAGVSFHCYSVGAPVYQFQEGAINVVRQGDVSNLAASVCQAAGAIHASDPESLQRQVGALMANYPEMTAPVVVAPLRGTARCEPGNPSLARTPCTANDRFAFATRPDL